MTHFYPQGVGNFYYSYVLKYRVCIICHGHVCWSALVALGLGRRRSI